LTDLTAQTRGGCIVRTMHSLWTS